MKEIKLYRCEKCGADFTNADECRRCEESHINAIMINHVRFEPFQRYPTSICAAMSDGSFVIYIPLREGAEE